MIKIFFLKENNFAVLLAILFISFFVISCTEIISIELQDGSGRYVITAKSDNHFGTSVIVQKTLPYFTDKSVESVYKNVSAKIIDHSDGDKEYILTLAGDSKYVYRGTSDGTSDGKHYYVRVFRSDFKAKKSDSYTMKVVIDGKEYSAKSTMPSGGLKITSEPVYTGWEETNYTAKYSVDFAKSGEYGYVAFMRDQSVVFSSDARPVASGSAFAAAYRKGIEEEYNFSELILGGEESSMARKIYQESKLCFSKVNGDTYNYLLAIDLLDFNRNGPPSKNPANPVSSWKDQRGDRADVLGHFYLQYINCFDIQPLPSL